MSGVATNGILKSLVLSLSTTVGATCDSFREADHTFLPEIRFFLKLSTIGSSWYCFSENGERRVLVRLY